MVCFSNSRTEKYFELYLAMKLQSLHLPTIIVTFPPPQKARDTTLSDQSRHMQPVLFVGGQNYTNPHSQLH
ncbi:MAG: hypothetical protein OEL84_01660 [Nitrosopumilus sp.]|nr:hypothetical protein [Nitrosopumilus sp.]